MELKNKPPSGKKSSALVDFRRVAIVLFVCCVLCVCEVLRVCFVCLFDGCHFFGVCDGAVRFYYYWNCGGDE